MVSRAWDLTKAVAVGLAAALAVLLLPMSAWGAEPEPTPTPTPTVTESSSPAPTETETVTETVTETAEPAEQPTPCGGEGDPCLVDYVGVDASEVQDFMIATVACAGVGVFCLLVSMIYGWGRR